MSIWRGGRVVECGSLENYFRVKPNGGSNPPLSVSYNRNRGSHQQEQKLKKEKLVVPKILMNMDLEAQKRSPLEKRSFKNFKN